MRQKIGQYIVRDSGIYGGRPVFTGTRIPIWIVADARANDASLDEIMDDFELTPEMIQAAVNFIDAGDYEPWEMDPSIVSPRRQRERDSAVRRDDFIIEVRPFNPFGTE